MARAWLALLAAVAVYLLTEWLVARSEVEFDIYGLNAVCASFAAGMAGLFVLAPRGAFARVAAVVYCVSAVLYSLVLLVVMAPRLLGAIGIETGGGIGSVLAWAAFGITPLGAVAMVLATRRVIVAAPTVRRPTLRAIGIIIGVVVCQGLVPYTPVFKGADFDQRTANVWEMAQTYLAYRKAVEASSEPNEVEREVARLEAAQPAALQRYLAGLPDREPGRRRVFLVGVGGWGHQQVFMRETFLALGTLGELIPGAAPPVPLINTLGGGGAPLANVQNIAQVLREVGARMDHANDLLVLTMTSHGDKQGIALRQASTVNRTLDPRTLKMMLDAAGIVNRVVIVSACHSGVFVPELQDDHTLVISAAAADRSSFGCSDDRELTYFGEAFFKLALPQEKTFIQSFEKARETIAAWEREQRLTPSNPQISVGRELQRRFPEIVGDLSAHVSASSELSEAPKP
jgi:hypothetical protein